MSLADEFLADFESSTGGDELIHTNTTSPTPLHNTPSPSSTIVQDKFNNTNNNNNTHSNTDNNTSNNNNNDTNFSTLLDPNHPSQQQLQNHLHQIHQFIPPSSSSSSSSSPISSSHLPDQSMEQSIKEQNVHTHIVHSNQWIIRINDEIQDLFQTIRSLYSCKFPELESHVLNALDYARVVLRIGHETDLSTIDMSDILPSSVVMIIRVTSSTSSFRQSDSDQVKKLVDRVMRACRQVLKLDEMRRVILSFVSSCMSFLAPNLSAIVGTEIAAQLVGVAGGLTALSKIPSADLQLLGKEKRNQFLGTMTATTNGQADLKYVGCIAECDLLRDTPPHLRKKVGRMIGSKCALVARVDLCRSSPDGSTGKDFRHQIESAILKLQEPSQGKQIKPLPAPDSKKKKTRGGKKTKRMKEMTKLSEIQKKKNRLAFGTNAEEEGDQQYGSSSGMGLLGVEGSGTLRMNALTKKTLRGANVAGSKTPGLSASSTMSSGTATQLRTGLASSLAFTPVQGIELENPLNAQKRNLSQPEPKKRYFSTMSFFKEPQLPAPKKQKQELK